MVEMAGVEMAGLEACEKRKPVGVYTFCNTGSVLVYEIDQTEDKVLAGINDDDPEWCDIEAIYSEETEQLELGFYLGSFFVPFFLVMRIEER